MKLLLLHVNEIEVDPTEKAIDDAEDDAEKISAEDALVVFVSIEKKDTKNDELVDSAVSEILDVKNQVNAERILVYPYVHLSSEPASPGFARKTTEKISDALEDGGEEVQTAPFGWYKAFQIDTKGHPLAELSREILPESEGEESEALEREHDLESSWYVMSPDGDLMEAEEFDFSDHPDLERLYDYETEGTRAAKEEPAHVRSMKEQELVDYEPGSDPGNLRWYPKGQLVKRLLESHVNEIVRGYGAMQVETPIMYDYNHPALSKYLDRFPARQYVVDSEGDDYFLRFAACFGQYLMGHDMTISWRNLPLRLYELSHYSFRREQSGEISGLRRLRAFTMPDMHTLTEDMDQATGEFLEQFDLCREWMDGLEVPYATAVRFVRDFYEENEELAAEMVERLGEPILIEMWDERFFYFVAKFEFNVIDSQDKASALSTVQIDVENTERFDISYTDSDGESLYGPLLHASISGSIDRNLYAILESQARGEEKSGWPFWLAPTQVRLIPVSGEFVEACEEIAGQLPVRVDIDDRDESVSKRIREAELEWVPMTVVYGSDEEESGKLPVRMRSGETRNIQLETLKRDVKKRQGDLPSEGLSLPRLLSKRPKFRG